MDGGKTSLSPPGYPPASPTSPRAEAGTSAKPISDRIRRAASSTLRQAASPRTARPPPGRPRVAGLVTGLDFRPLRPDRVAGVLTSGLELFITPAPIFNKLHHHHAASVIRFPQFGKPCMDCVDHHARQLSRQNPRPDSPPGQNPRSEPSGQNQKSTSQRLMLFQIHRMASLGRFYQPVRSIIICAFVAFSARAEIGRVSGLNDPHDATSVSGETAALTGNS